MLASTRQVLRGCYCALFLLQFPAIARAASSSDFNIYWGDLHGHTMVAPVNLTPQVITNYILYARDTVGLDFVALTEKDFDLSDSEWSTVKSQAAQYTASSNFIAFSGFEWGDEGFDNFGHRGVLYKTDSQPLLRSDVSTSDHVGELIERVQSTTDGLTAINHPDLSNYSTDWDYFDGSSDRVAEIYSRHGHFEGGAQGLQQALSSGYRFGFIATSDTRNGTPGSHGLTAILTTSLKKTNLHDALQARRVYATTGARIGLWFAADGKEMGSEFSSATGPSLSIECTPTAPLDRIEILKNNIVVYTWTPGGSIVLPDTEWASAAPRRDQTWTKPGFDSAIEPEGELELTAPAADGVYRVRQTYVVTDPQAPFILRPGLTGDYRLWVNGELLVDTRQLQQAPQHVEHDCFADDGQGLVGSLEHFHHLGFYNLAALGVPLKVGENVIALESKLDPSKGGATGGSALQLQATAAMAPVQFSWADNNFSGPSFYYMRLTQTDGHEAWASPVWVNRLAPDTTAPRAAVKLRANKTNNDVYLDWPKVTKDIDGNIESLDFYRIFRGTTAGFVPDRVGLSNQIGTATKSYYKDTNALLAATNYFYRVVAVDNAGNESVDLSNLAYKLHQSLTYDGNRSNIHWLSLLWQSIYSTADEFVRDLNEGATGVCTKVFGWDLATQSPVSWFYYKGQWVGTDFDLTPGHAIGVTISADLQAILVGAHDEGTAVRLTPHISGSSVNWISVPAHTPHFFASSLVNDINAGPFPTIVSRVVRFAPNQVYQTYQWTGSIWSGTNFVLMPGDAYSVEVKTVFDWVPKTIDD